MKELRCCGVAVSERNETKTSVIICKIVCICKLLQDGKPKEEYTFLQFFCIFLKM